MSTACACRDVVWTPKFREQYEFMGKGNPQGFDTIMQPMMWAVTTAPEECYCVPGTGVRIIKLLNSNKDPFISVSFTFDDATVTMLGIGYTNSL